MDPLDPSEYVDQVNPSEYVEGRGNRGAVPLAGSVPASEAEVTRLLF